ncbi:hypothetical protein JTE90_020835 [Oedothorax gibbosus]|uniref:Uncharacterized protein n=1 Tax=Oedothorax gibbosus TaxID=931172 RepID=A0AAV6U0A6_9ARAC|nr:hypothetical protein JTE90_020835 [Oedothorax gibbosus]
MEDTQQTGPEEQAAATSTKCRKQLPKRYVLAIMCNLAFFFRGLVVANIGQMVFVKDLSVGLVVANIGQMVFVKDFVAGSDLYPKVTNTTLKEMSNIVFSYHWVIILGQMPAAILVYKYSARKIMITSMILSSFLQITTPWTLSKSLAGTVLNVFFQSLCLCPLDYACIGLLGNWAPSTERNRLLMMSFTGRFAHYQLAYLLSFKLLT